MTSQGQKLLSPLAHSEDLVCGPLPLRTSWLLGWSSRVSGPASCVLGIAPGNDLPRLPLPTSTSQPDTPLVPPKQSNNRVSGMVGLPNVLPPLRLLPRHSARPSETLGKCVLVDELMNKHKTSSLRRPQFSLVASVHLQGIRWVSE